MNNLFSGINNYGRTISDFPSKEIARTVAAAFGKLARLVVTFWPGITGSSRLDPTR